MKFWNRNFFILFILGYFLILGMVAYAQLGGGNPTGSGGIIANQQNVRTSRLTGQAAFTIQGVGAAAVYPSIIWSPSFPDANYTVTFTCVGPTLLSPVIVGAINKTSVGVNPMLGSLVAGSSACTEVDAIAIHD